MELLIVRHALAGEKTEFASTGLPDSARPVTKEGRKAMRKAARGLGRIVPELGVILTSPLLRAVQTARVLSKFYRKTKLKKMGELAPGGDFQKLLAKLVKMKKRETIGLVGHEPFLTDFAGWLLTGKKRSFMELGKGGALLLEIKDPAREGGAVLKWSLGAKLLSKIKN